MSNKEFVAADYVVFVLVLLVSAAIGIFYGCCGKKKQTTTDYLLAGRSMNFMPVALSLLASFMSAITLLGTPAEIYQYGTIYWWIWVAYALLIPCSAHIFLPVFYRLKVVTVYEYLELRFKSKAVRMSAAVTFSVQMIMYMAIVLYAPSLALNQVTGLNVWISVFSIGIVCTFYTAIGGMKAVMWTDTFQIIMMFAGLIAVLVRGSMDHDGFANIWEANEEGKRVEFDVFDTDPFERHTFWTLAIGGGFTWLAIYGVNQAQVQRALCVPTLRDGQKALWLNLPGLTGLMTVCGLAGMVIYAEYKDCDPISNGDVDASDQLLPYYVMDRLSSAPGLPGLFTASLFSGALSTISSGLNSLAAVALQDIIRTTKWKDLSEERATLVSKVLAVVYGLLCIALTFVAAELGDVLQAALALFGMIGGPLLGLFILGMLFPCANWIGALVSLFTGLMMTLWVGIGAQIYKPILEKKPFSTANCTVEDSGMSNLTTIAAELMSTISTTTTEAPTERSGFTHWYELSYLHYGTLAVVWVVVVGVIVSLLTGPMMPEEVDSIYLNPMCDIFCCCIPRKAREWCRCFLPLYDTEAELQKEAEKQWEEKVHPDDVKVEVNGELSHGNPGFELEEKTQM